MELAFLISIILLLLFTVLGLYDGFYLHIYRYKLFLHPESKNEHLVHTIRAILFPAILYYLYLGNTTLSFIVGIALVLFDLLILGIDAYMEHDSRAFMNGLPRWEYVIHLFVNGFHFAAISVYLIIKIDIDSGVTIINDFSTIRHYHNFKWLVENLIPGAVLMSVIHLLVMIPLVRQYWDTAIDKLNCCQPKQIV